MVLIRKKATISVVEAARIRVRKALQRGKLAYVWMSGGKDSVVMAQIIYDEIISGNADPRQLRVLFVDEEAIFPGVDETVRIWKARFEKANVPFYWMCLEVVHFNCFNSLTNDESFICWDRNKEDVWIRRPPDFAVRSHPLLKPRVDSYQKFGARLNAGKISFQGLRVAESVQRLLALSKKASNDIVYPIYDWRDEDVWRFILERKLEFPVEYLWLWQIGVSRRDLRISQFFSIDTAKHIVNLQEFYPGLAEQINRREPGAYLACLYWDSEMFRRSRGKAAKEEDASRDYKALTLGLLSDISGNFPTKHQQHVADRYKAVCVAHGSWFEERNWKQAYHALKAGDPKMRTLRGMTSTALKNREKVI